MFSLGPVVGIFYCVEAWSVDWHRKMYNAFLFAVVYAVPCCLVLTAYTSMGCKLCVPSVVNSTECELPSDPLMIDIGAAVRPAVSHAASASC